MEPRLGYLLLPCDNSSKLPLLQLVMILYNALYRMILLYSIKCHGFDCGLRLLSCPHRVNSTCVGSPEEVNVKGTQRGDLLRLEEELKNEAPVTFFDVVQLEVVNLLQRDVFPRFRRKLVTANLNETTAREALYLGRSLRDEALLIGFMRLTCPSQGSFASSPRLSY